MLGGGGSHVSKTTWGQPRMPLLLLLFTTGKNYYINLINDLGESVFGGVHMKF